MHAPLQHKATSTPAPRRQSAKKSAATKVQQQPRSQAAFDLTNIPISPAVQPKLAISQPGDRSEQEADRIADRVMTMPEPQLQRQVDEEDEEVSPQLIQRQETGEEDDEEVSPKLIQRHESEEEDEEVSPNLIQRQAEPEEDEEESISPKAHSGGLTVAPLDIADSISAMRGGGSPLPDSTRAFFEPRFGRDFSNVRIHTGSRAADSAQAINARAFTVGRDIAFGESQYSPDSQGGRQLLAHELAHVVLGSKTPINQRGANVFDSGSQIVPDIQPSFISFAFKMGAKKISKGILKNFIKTKIRKKIRNIVNKRIAKKLTKQADELMGILEDPWWATAIGFIPIAGDIFDLARVPMQIAKAMRKADKLEERANRILRIERARRKAQRIIKEEFKLIGHLRKIWANRRLYMRWIKANQSLSRKGNPLTYIQARQIIANARKLGIKKFDFNAKGLQGLEKTGQWADIPHFKIGNIHIPVQKGFKP
ncbi:MAG: DUF4157 domain-containing protein [Candidatus Marinimicrobia bacterium]|nr:DUF4157 domain-containing protein [Candidatus Neomarinimicrobiota bacterium]